MTIATNRTLAAAKMTLTIVALEFFGPLVRDFSPSHALNPDWVGHARLHLVWLLGFMGLSGLVNLWLIWAPSRFAVRNLWLSVVWQSCNIGGFWASVLLVPVYGGVVTMPDTHVHVFGFDENVFAFAVLTGLLLVAILLLISAERPKENGDAHR